MAIFGLTRSYYKKFKFQVEILGVVFAGFKSCGEIGIEVAAVEEYEGGALIPQSSPGRVTIPTVELARGATDDLDLYLWMQQVVGADAVLVDPDYKRTIDIVQQNRRGSELRRWTLVNAWPIKWVGGEWDNSADENTVEKITLKYDYPILGG